MGWRKYPECEKCLNNKAYGFGSRKEGGCLYPNDAEYGIGIFDKCKDFKSRIDELCEKFENE